jgi:hypothetical protein
MMRRFSMLGTALLVTLALTAVAAGSAWGAVDLKLKHNGEEAAKGSSTVAAILVDECVEFSEGTLTTNGAATDKAKLTHSVDSECPEGTKLTGSITAASLTTKGAMSLTAKLTLTLPGPCSYAITKVKLSFTPSGGSSFGEGTVTGKLGKGSAKSCAKTLSAPGEGGLITSLGELAPYETELT